MYCESIAQSLSVVDALYPQVITANLNSNAVDMLYWERALYTVQVNALNGTTPSIAVQMQGSVNGTSGWTNLSNANTNFLTANVNTNNSTIKVGVKGEDLGGNNITYYRYVRAQIQLNGSVSPNATISLQALGGIGRWKPANKYKEISSVANTILD